MTVHRAIHGQTAVLTLDRPDEGNRLDGETLQSLRTHLEELNDVRVGVLILQSEGSDFCLGRQGRRGAGLPDPGEVDELIRLMGGVNQLLQTFPGVTISAVQGRAVGAGLSLAGRCDLVLAESDARLSFPEIVHGIAPTFVMSHYRFTLPRKVINDMVLTGREMTAEEGLSVGLVSRIVPQGEVKEQARALADQVTGYDAEALRMIKEFLVVTEELTPATAIEYGNAMMKADIYARKLQ